MFLKLAISATFWEDFWLPGRKKGENINSGKIIIFDLYGIPCTEFDHLVSG